MLTEFLKEKLEENQKKMSEANLAKYRVRAICPNVLNVILSICQKIMQYTTPFSNYLPNVVLSVLLVCFIHHHLKASYCSDWDCLHGQAFHRL